VSISVSLLVSVPDASNRNPNPTVIMPPPLIGGGIKRRFCTSVCLTSVCRVHQA